MPDGATKRQARHTTDCTSQPALIAAYMERDDLEYLYSFDDDFDTIEWVTRLETATDPFGPSDVGG